MSSWYLWYYIWHLFVFKLQKPSFELIFDLMLFWRRERRYLILCVTKIMKWIFHGWSDSELSCKSKQSLDLSRKSKTFDTLRLIKKKASVQLLQRSVSNRIVKIFTRERYQVYLKVIFTCLVINMYISSVRACTVAKSQVKLYHVRNDGAIDNS